MSVEPRMRAVGQSQGAAAAGASRRARV